MRLVTLFIWIVLPIAAYATYAIHGLPHAIWSYRYQSPGGTRDPLAERYYLDCTFTGPYGAFTVPAENGRCGWFRFFKPASA